MILEGLNFGEFVETDPHLKCTQLTEVVRPLLQMIFILSQTYFIFRNSKACLRFLLFSPHTTFCNCCRFRKSFPLEQLQKALLFTSVLLLLMTMTTMVAVVVAIQTTTTMTMLTGSIRSTYEPLTCERCDAPNVTNTLEQSSAYFVPCLLHTL